VGFFTWPIGGRLWTFALGGAVFMVGGYRLPLVLGSFGGALSWLRQPAVACRLGVQRTVRVLVIGLKTAFSGWRFPLVPALWSKGTVESACSELHR